MPCHAWKCVPGLWCGYFWGSRVLFVSTDEFSVKVKKNTSRIGVSWTHSLPSVFNQFLTQWVMAILSKGRKPDNFESHNSLKLNFTNIWGLQWKFVGLSWIKHSWHLFSVWDKLGWLKWFWQFLCKRLSSFNLKWFYHTYTWSCSLCEGRTFFCTGLIPRKLCRFLFMFLTGFTSLSSALLFFVYQSPSSLYVVFDLISSNIEEVLSINPSANVFVFGDFKVQHKDLLTYSGGTDRPGELCHNFSISNDFTQMVNFCTWIPDYDSQSQLFWMYFFLLMQVAVPQSLSLHWEILIMLFSKFPLTSQKTQNRMPRFIA